MTILPPTPSLRFLFGSLVCLAFSLAAMRWIAPLGWMDHPAGRRQHGSPTPRTGGLALLAALVVGWSTHALNLPLERGEWAVVYAIGLMGVVDDRFDLRARWKALASLAAGAVLSLLSWGALRAAGPHLPLFFGGLATFSPLTPLLLWAWYWSIPQACNLIDGMNGLALGFFLMLALSMGLPSAAGGEGTYLLGVILTLALLNWPRGRQFLGDSGSLALGTLFSVLGVHLVAVASPNRLLGAFAYPITDVLMVMAIRLANGRPLGQGDRNHFHHQWQRVLPGHPQAVLALTLLPALACMQVLQSYPGHGIVAWSGLSWLALSAAWFVRRSTRPQTGRAADEQRPAGARSGAARWGEEPQPGRATVESIAKSL